VKLHKWEQIEKTTESGKVMYRCSGCGWESPHPTRGECGKCSKCGHYIGSIGHALECTDDLSPEDRATVERLRGGVEAKKEEAAHDDHVVKLGDGDVEVEVRMHSSNIRWGQRPTAMVSCLPMADDSTKVLAVVCGGLLQVIAFSTEVGRLAGRRVMVGMLRGDTEDLADAFGVAGIGVWPEEAAASITEPFGELNDHPLTWASHFVEVLVNDPRRGEPPLINRQSAEIIRDLFRAQCARMSN